MKWLQDNPLGTILAAISGVFIFLALGMTIVGNLPVSIDTSDVETETTSDSSANLATRQVGALDDYLVVNEKPVFNESRQPVIGDSDSDETGVSSEIEIKGAPDVRLTGVVITPGVKVASLTPADGNLETVRAHEGESLTGEFVGWHVTAINPRAVVLESRDGQSLELDLQIHDTKIEAPVAPVAPVAQVSAQAKNAQALAGKASEEAGEDGEPLTRAEQIRQRIAERRAELRQEQEAQQSQNGGQATTAGSSTKTKDYQTAIREMMKNKNKDNGSNDKKDR